MELGDGHLKVQRASVGITQVAGVESVNAMTMLAGTTNTNIDESRVLMLLNMVTAEELMDSQAYQGKSSCRTSANFDTNTSFRNPGRCP